MNKIDGGPAFPRVVPKGVDWYAGMSLRDYFAGQVIAGIGIVSAPGAVAARAYALADAMIAARENVDGPTS